MLKFLWYFTPLFCILAALVGILIFTAAFTLVERKLMGLYQRREGPDRVGFEGIGQPFADGLKLLRKEIIIPKDSPEQRIFFISPIISLWINLVLWSFIPFSPIGSFFQEESGLILILGFSSLGSYGVIYAGWSSNNKYALLGAFRAVAQFISYEILFSLIFLPVVSATSSVNLTTIAIFQAKYGWFVYLVPLWVLSFIVILAETNRTPFDLPEAEAELVAGFNVEYSSLLFAFFFLAEYSSMGFFAALVVTLFFGGWSLNPFGTYNNENSKFMSMYWRTVEPIRAKLKYKKGKSFVSRKSLPFDLQHQTLQTIKRPTKDEYGAFAHELHLLDRTGSLESTLKFVTKKDPLAGLVFNTRFYYPTEKDLAMAFKPYPTNFEASHNAHAFILPVYKVFHKVSTEFYTRFFNAYDNLFAPSSLFHPLKIQLYEIFFEQIFFVFIVAFKVQIFCTLFIFIRASLPRKRFDQLIQLCWKYFFPFILSFVLFVISIQCSSVLYHLSDNAKAGKASFKLMFDIVANYLRVLNATTRHSTIQFACTRSSSGYYLYRHTCKWKCVFCLFPLSCEKNFCYKRPHFKYYQ